MKVLIIGATGMLAKPVIEQLAGCKHSLRLFSRSIQASHFDDRYEIMQGDLFDPQNLSKAIEGCDAIHINISKLDEGEAVELIARAAQEHKIKLISYVSGATVCKENSWFWMISQKYKAEQAIKQSGVPYLIFRPSWFFESLELFIRNNKAAVIGKQPHANAWVAAADFARMLSTAYQDPSKWNQILYVLGPKKYQVKSLLEAYCKERHPDITKVSNAPIGLIKLIGWLSRNKELKLAVDIFSYFEKTQEPQVPIDTGSSSYWPHTDFNRWMETKT